MLIGKVIKTLICNNSFGEEVGRIIVREGIIFPNGEPLKSEPENYYPIYGVPAGKSINWDSMLLDEKLEDVSYKDLYRYACDFFKTDLKFTDCICA